MRGRELSCRLTRPTLPVAFQNWRLLPSNLTIWKIIRLWSLWKSQRVEKRILSHVWQSLHGCWCCEWVSVRGWGECESIRGGVYAKTSEEVLEACDGAHKLSFLLLQCRNVLLQLALWLGQSLHLTLQAGDASMWHLEWGFVSVGGGVEQWLKSENKPKTDHNLCFFSSECLCMCVCVPATPPGDQGSAVGGSDWSSLAVQLAGVGWGLGACPEAHPARHGTPPRRPAAAWTHPSHKPISQDKKGLLWTFLSFCIFRILDSTENLCSLDKPKLFSLLVHNTRFCKIISVGVHMGTQIMSAESSYTDGLSTA